MYEKLSSLIIYLSVDMKNLKQIQNNLIAVILCVLVCLCVTCYIFFIFFLTHLKQELRRHFSHLKRIYANIISQCKLILGYFLLSRRWEN